MSAHRWMNRAFEYFVDQIMEGKSSDSLQDVLPDINASLTKLVNVKDWDEFAAVRDEIRKEVGDYVETINDRVTELAEAMDEAA